MASENAGAGGTNGSGGGGGTGGAVGGGGGAGWLSNGGGGFERRWRLDFSVLSPAAVGFRASGRRLWRRRRRRRHCVLRRRRRRGLFWRRRRLPLRPTGGGGGGSYLNPALRDINRNSRHQRRAMVTYWLGLTVFQLHRSGRGIHHSDHAAFYFVAAVGAQGGPAIAATRRLRRRRRRRGVSDAKGPNWTSWLAERGKTAACAA